MDAPILRINNNVDNSSWKKILLGDALDLIKDGTHGTHKDVEDGPYLLSAKNIKKGKIVFNESDRKISEKEYNQIYKNYSLENNDILLTVVGSIGEVAIYQEFTTEKIAFQRSVAILRSNQKNNPSFLGYLMQTYNFKKLLNIHKVVSAQPGIYLGDLAKLPIFIPNKLEEQNKIALFFDTLSKKINLQQEKINLLKEQKKGYIQKIFSQELRFRDENGKAYPNWKQEYLGNLCDINTGNKDTQNKIDNGKYPFFVRSQIVEKINSYSYDGEAILTAGDGVGVGKVFHYINGKFDFHQRVYMLNNFKGCVGKFIYYYFSNNFMREAQKYNAKTSVDSVRREMLTKMVFPFPSVEEQKKISDFLSQLDNKITLEEQIKTTLQSQKQAFMQQMFI